MSATTVVQIASYPDVVVVPLDFVFDRGDQKVVRVLRGGRHRAIG